RVLDLSTQQARSLHHDHVGSLHFLLGLRTAVPSLAAYALKSAGVEADELVAELRKLPMGEVLSPVKSDPVVTPSLRRVFEHAAKQAERRAAAGIGSEDLLTALLQEHNGDSSSAAVEYLSARGINVEEILQHL